MQRRGWKSLAGVPAHRGIKSIVSEMDFRDLKNFRNLVIQGDTEFYVTSVPFSMDSSDGKLIIMQNTAKKQSIERKRRAAIQRAKESFRNDNDPIPDDLAKFFNKSGGINWHAVQRAENSDGLSFLFTNSRISRKEALKIYFTKDVVERCFNLEKSVLNLRPIRFWLDSKIKSHVLVCHISLALLTTFRIRLENSGLTCTLEQGLKELNSIYKIKLNAKKGSKLHFNLVNTMSNQQTATLKAVAPKINL